MCIETVGFRLLRVVRYDNSRAVRKWTPCGPSTQGIWAWAVKEEDMAMFLDEYANAHIDQVEVFSGDHVYAIKWDELDAHICGQSETPPLSVRFDARVHCVRREMRQPLCWCGCGKPDGDVHVWFENHWAVWVKTCWERRYPLTTSGARQLLEEWEC